MHFRVQPTTYIQYDHENCSLVNAGFGVKFIDDGVKQTKKTTPTNLFIETERLNSVVRLDDITPSEAEIGKNANIVGGRLTADTRSIHSSRSASVSMGISPKSSDESTRSSRKNLASPKFDIKCTSPRFDTSTTRVRRLNKKCLEVSKASLDIFSDQSPFDDDQSVTSNSNVKHQQQLEQQVITDLEYQQRSSSVASSTNQHARSGAIEIAVADAAIEFDHELISVNNAYNNNNNNNIHNHGIDMDNKTDRNLVGHQTTTDTSFVTAVKCLAEPEREIDVPTSDMKNDEVLEEDKHIARDYDKSTSEDERTKEIGGNRRQIIDNNIRVATLVVDSAAAVIVGGGSGDTIRFGSGMTSSASSRGSSSQVVSPIAICGARIVNDDSMFLADVYIENSMIKQVSSSLEIPKGVKVYDGTGKLLLPAGIDAYTNFNAIDSVNGFKAGSECVLSGGTATVIDVIRPVGSETILHAYERYCEAATNECKCNYSFSVVITEYNEKIMKEMETLVHSKGINNFIFELHDEEQLFEAFLFCKAIGAYARVSTRSSKIIAFLEKRMKMLNIRESSDKRIEMIEEDMISRIGTLSDIANCPVGLLSASKNCVGEIIQRNSQSLIYPEVAISALEVGRCHNYLDKNGMDISKLLHCLSNTPLCMCVSAHYGASRDLMFERSKKRMHILWEKTVESGLIDPMRFVAVTSSNAAKVFNLYPRKGRIAVGADADLVLWDPAASRKSMSTNVVLTVCGGHVAYHQGKCDSGCGSFNSLAPDSPHLFYRIRCRERLREGHNSNQRKASDEHHMESDTSVNQKYSHRSHLESNFSMSGAQSDDALGVRASKKIVNPPGGRSTGFW